MRRFKPTGRGWWLTRKFAIGIGSMALVVGSGRPTFAQVTDGETTVAEDAPGMIGIIFSGGVLGAPIILFLLALSVTAAYLVIEHLLTVRRKDLMPEGLNERVRNSLANGQTEQAEQACRDQPSMLSFVLLHGIAELDFGWTSVEKALEDAISEQSARLFRKIEYLSVIGNIAPMVGLLGTVIGMILAFQQVATTQGSAGAGDLAEGIYQALVTTVGGLIVAIPALGAFAIFRNRVDQFVAEAAYMSQHVFSPLRRKGNKKGAANTSTAATGQPATPPPAPRRP